MLILNVRKDKFLCIWALVLIYSTQVNPVMAGDVTDQQHEVANTPAPQTNAGNVAINSEKENIHVKKNKPKPIADELAGESIEDRGETNKPILDTSEMLIAELVEMRANLDEQLKTLIDYQDAQRENPYGPFGYYDFLKSKDIKKTENGYTYTYLTKGKGGLASKGQLVKVSLSEKLVNGRAISQTDGVTFRYTDTLPLFIRDLLQDVPRGSKIKMIVLAKDVYHNDELPISIEKNTAIAYNIHIFNEV